MGISFRNVSHSYYGLNKKDVTIALEDINLEISDKDEFVSIIGKTGAGKSSLIEHMNALKLPTKGTVEIFDYIITPKKKKNPKLKQVRKRVGFVFQFPEYQLFEETVLKDIMFAPKNFGMSEQEAKKKAIEVAETLNIKNLLNKSPFNLSGGQMRKCAIAGILAYDPDILLLDEPTRGLDPQSSKEIMELFYDIHKRLGKTIVLITHDMNLVYEYSTRVIVLNDSHITYDGDKQRLFENEEFVRENHLTKPDVLKLIDYLNKKLNYNIDYNTHNLDELLKKVVKLHG